MEKRQLLYSPSNSNNKIIVRSGNLASTHLLICLCPLSIVTSAFPTGDLNKSYLNIVQHTHENTGAYKRIHLLRGFFPPDPSDLKAYSLLLLKPSLLSSPFRDHFSKEPHTKALNHKSILYNLGKTVPYFLTFLNLSFNFC